MYIQLNSQVLCYEKTGEGSPIILLHGNGEDHTIFQELTQKLQQHHTVYAVDSRGHGGSATPKEFHYEDMAGDIISLIETLEINHPALYGFSDGAIVGILIALRRPELLSHLILSGANLSPKGLHGSARREIKAQYKKTQSPLYKLMMEEPNISPQELENIQLPVLVTAGDKDIVKSQETKKIASFIPGAQLKIFPRENHSSYVIHSDYMADIIEEFI